MHSQLANGHHEWRESAQSSQVHVLAYAARWEALRELRSATLVLIEDAAQRLSRISPFGERLPKMEPWRSRVFAFILRKSLDAGGLRGWLFAAMMRCATKATHFSENTEWNRLLPSRIGGNFDWTKYRRQYSRFKLPYLKSGAAARRAAEDFHSWICGLGGLKGSSHPAHPSGNRGLPKPSVYHNMSFAHRCATLARGS